MTQVSGQIHGIQWCSGWIFMWLSSKTWATLSSLQWRPGSNEVSTFESIVFKSVLILVDHKKVVASCSPDHSSGLPWERLSLLSVKNYSYHSRSGKRLDSKMKASIDRSIHIIFINHNTRIEFVPYLEKIGIHSVPEGLADWLEKRHFLMKQWSTLFICRNSRSTAQTVPQLIGYIRSKHCRHIDSRKIICRLQLQNDRKE